MVSNEASHFVNKATQVNQSIGTLEQSVYNLTSSQWWNSRSTLTEGNRSILSQSDDVIHNENILESHLFHVINNDICIIA